jgi:hypothetical protein
MFKLIFALIIVIFSLENDALPTFGGDRLEVRSSVETIRLLHTF